MHSSVTASNIGTFLRWEAARRRRVKSPTLAVAHTHEIIGHTLASRLFLTSRYVQRAQRCIRIGTGYRFSTPTFDVRTLFVSGEPPIRPVSGSGTVLTGSPSTDACLETR